MGKFTKEMVDDYADKLLIGLTAEENKKVLDEFEEIDSSIARINEIEDISQITPMTHALDDFVCEFREDIKEESIPKENIFTNCDDSDEDFVVVPRMVG